jgi:hypothetical protein
VEDSARAAWPRTTESQGNDPMPRTITHLFAAAAIVLLAAGPAAASTAATTGNAPTIVNEPIDQSGTHEEPDGSVTAYRQLGTRTSFTYPDGRYMLREEYTDHQVLTDASGALIFDSVSETSVHVIAKGERTILFRSISETAMTRGDGSECTMSFVFMIANDKLIKMEQVGPICS